jgi:hypothetical protein
MIKRAPSIRLQPKQPSLLAPTNNRDSTALKNEIVVVDSEEDGEIRLCPIEEDLDKQIAEAEEELRLLLLEQEEEERLILEKLNNSNSNETDEGLGVSYDPEKEVIEDGDDDGERSNYNENDDNLGDYYSKVNGIMNNINDDDEDEYEKNAGENAEDDGTEVSSNESQVDEISGGGGMLR